MRLGWALLIASAVAGCAPAPPPPPASRPEPPPVVAPKAQPGDNPQRAYQLRELDRADISVAGHKLKVWVMDTSDKREEGLMWVTGKEIKPGEGMIFVYARPDKLGFWMKNTIVALDIAYFGADKRLINIVHGQPRSERSLWSAAAAQYVLEVKAGTLAKLGIRPGARLVLPASVLASQ